MLVRVRGRVERFRDELQVDVHHRGFMIADGLLSRDVDVLGVKAGVVRVRLTGACSGCTAAAVTLASMK